MNVTGIMASLQALVEAFQEPQSKEVMDATGHLASAAISTQAGIIFTESVEPVMVMKATIRMANGTYKFKGGVDGKRVWEEMEKAV